MPGPVEGAAVYDLVRERVHGRVEEARLLTTVTVVMLVTVTGEQVLAGSATLAGSVVVGLAEVDDLDSDPLPALAVTLGFVEEEEEEEEEELAGT